MTIAIRIENTDSRDTAIVEVKTANAGVKSLLPIVNKGKQLKGGESLTQYVHSGQSILIEEIHNG